MFLGTQVARVGIVAALVIVLLPSSTSALTFVQVVGLFHIVVGLLLTFTLLTFVTAIGVYIARLNTWPSHRETAIRAMEWGVVMLFVLIILLALVDFFQRHRAIALPILAFIIIVVVAIFVVRMAAQSKKKAASRPPAGGARPAR